MISTYFKTGIRNLFKRKGYSLLNILGLATGMTCCLLIFHYVSYERSYDATLSSNIYRIRLDSYQQGKLAWKSATSYPGVPPLMKHDFPEVEDYCRLIDAEMLMVNEANNTKFNEKKGYYADKSVIPMFGITLLSGNAATALDEPRKMIISEKMAKKYFGNEGAIGKRLLLKDEGTSTPYEVSGVFKDHPDNSHLVIDYLISYESLKKMLIERGVKNLDPETSVNWYDFYSYIQLKPGTDLKKLEAKFPAFCKRYIGWETPEDRTELAIIPVKDIHLYSNYNQEAEVNGNGQMVSFLFLIAIFIICIAWTNYINLSTARSVERAKEVGVKKVLGATRNELIKQFLTENFILNIVSLCIAIVLFYLLLPGFDAFSGREALTGVSLTPYYAGMFILFFFSGTLLSGLYPAFVLSGFEPSRVLKGAFKNSSGGLVLRKVLIVTQFVITVILIAGTVIVYQQVRYMRQQSLGANIEQTLVLRGPSSITDSAYRGMAQPFKNTLLHTPGIKRISASTSVMSQEIYWTNGAARLGHEGSTLYFLGVDPDYIPAYDMKFKSGRNFSKDFGTDQKAVILNEKAALLLGFENAKAAVNQKIRQGNDTSTVIGVVADYHQEGLQKAIFPMIIRPMDNVRNYYSIKINTQHPSETIATIEKTWNSYFPSDPFSYFFLDDTFDAQYKTDILFGKVFGIFACIAILIACLGLLGLSAYNVLQRQKEIGIRKVLGASSENILLLLSKDFVRLVTLSFVIALPLGWYIMHSWLQDFAYHIELHWWIFAMAAIITLLIAAATIVLQALRAATANPVKSLRIE